MKGESLMKIDMRSDLLMVVELLDNEDGNQELQITENSMEPFDLVSIIQYCVSRLHKASNIPYNEILNDLKIKGEED